MRKSIFSVAALAAVLALSACEKAATDANGPYTGTWRYKAIGVVDHHPTASSTPCDYESVFDVTQTGNQLVGQSRAGSEMIRCGNATTATLLFPSPHDVSGEIENGRVHLYNSTGHNFGEVEPDRMSGIIERYWQTSQDGPVVVDTVGTFVIERVP